MHWLLRLGFGTLSNRECTQRVFFRDCFFGNKRTPPSKFKHDATQLLSTAHSTGETCGGTIHSFRLRMTRPVSNMFWSSRTNVTCEDPKMIAFVLVFMYSTAFSDSILFFQKSCQSQCHSFKGSKGLEPAEPYALNFWRKCWLASQLPAHLTLGLQLPQ